MSRILNYMTVGGLVLFALFGWTGLSLSSAGAILLLLVTIASAPAFFHALKCDAAGWLIIAAMLYLIGHFFLVQQPERTPDTGALQDWFLLWLFPAVAWAFKERSPSFVRAVLALAAIGLLVPVAWYIQWDAIAVFFSQRHEYQISSVPMGLYSGLVVFGLFVFLDALMIASTKLGQWVRVGAIALWGVALVLALTAFVTTQSRGSWLAFSVAAFVVMIFLAVRYRANILTTLHEHRLPMIMALGVVLFFLWLTHGVVEQRIMRESEVYQALPTLDREEIPYTSVGRRLHMWIYGVEKWSERPLVGLGMGGAAAVLAQDPKLARHPHFHNAYLQIGVELGLLGLVFFGGVLVLLVYRLTSRFQAHDVPLDLFVFLVGAWVMILSWGMIDTRFSQSDGRFLFLMLLGITMAFGNGWTRKRV